ncbi:TrpB-like pyridoxal phosphate-dependent enzyme [Marinomonas sp. TI.3.20]|uniref:TrpB-like pyridoxal phosphate-dependent enzyme n=1 Tax=Marinomonas sp. TI.3.20 TaxID=3121296 RepID=UPI00311FCB43
MDNNLVPKKWCNLLKDFPSLYNESIHENKDLNLNGVGALPRQPLSLLRQSHNTDDADILIPQEILDQYLLYRPTPFRRAVQLENHLNTKTKIFYKYEGANISGSHKLNSALAQAFYYKKAGYKHLVTGTGAGQWGSALAYACKVFGLKCTIFMVDVSLNQKPQRRDLMELYGATVYSSPSTETKVGLDAIKKGYKNTGTLAIATGEAIIFTKNFSDAQFAVGSGENNVLLHQTIIGNEVLNQLEELDIFPDRVYACVGAGSNFAGIAFPILRYSKSHNKNCKFIAVEPIACPKLTRGIYTTDINDFSGTTPLSKMYTLGSKYNSPPIHAGGLRYHGTSSFLSALYHTGFITATSISEEESLSAGLLFSQKEGILPAPESSYAIAAAIRDIHDNSKLDESIIINISGHGLYDMLSYQDYLLDRLIDDEPDEEMIKNSLSEFN